MLLASVALAIVVGAGFAILLIPIQHARDAERRAVHSQDVLLAANGVEERVLDLETGQRGFILTRQPEFLIPWEQAREQLPQQEQALLELVRGDSAQEARVREIASAARSYIDDYSVPLVNAAARADPSAKTVAATAEGEARVGVIRADFAQLLQAERRTSGATASASATAAHRAYAGLVVGIGVSIALVALYASYLTRAIVGPIRRAATLAGRIAGGDLTARLPETGVGEVGALQRAFNVMGASLERGRDELTALADEQAGLRRVATLVAQGASAGDVLTAVAAEIGQLLPVDHVLIGRYDTDGGGITTVGSWSREAGPADFPAHWGAGVRNLAALVRRTGRPARTQPDEACRAHSGPNGRPPGVRSSVGVPIHVDADLWGIVIAASTREEPMPEAAETRLGSFTELVSTAIANAEAKAALTASRARIIVTADETRRQFQRDLHDGAQQRFVSVLLRLHLAQAAVPAELPGVAADLDVAVIELKGAIDALRDHTRGIHPASLKLGLRPALDALAHESAMPVDLDVRMDGRLPEPIEIAVYYIVSEALTNAAKHGQASNVTVRVEAADDRLRLDIRDDGVGGARFGRGSGLVGLRDRVEALGGSITLQSEPAAGTSLEVELPLTASVGATH
ncbi:MAG: CHASE3 domain-containing protein [Solirubrobacterales bacterium]|nr:CHASE3 domain-containing protein [Solirubrobacterales bacterium]